MKQSRYNIILLALTLVLALAACTSTENTNSNPAGPPEGAEQAPAEEVPAEEAPEAEAIAAGTAAESMPAADDDSTISLVDGLGNTITLDGPAQQIVSLAPSNTELLFAVGAGEQVVGRDAFSDFPAEALAIADIGGGFAELDMETIIALEPDLILTADITAPEQVQALTDVGLVVFAIPNPIELAAVFDNLRMVAQLTGHEAEAEALVGELEERVEAVTQRVAGVDETPLVFYELDATEPDAPWTSGPGTYMDILIAMAGAQNVGAVLEGAWAQISIEELIDQDPDIILLGDNLYGGITPDAVAARSSWQDLTAVQNAQVYIFDDNLVSRPGPRLVEGLEALARQFHPELFE